MASCTRGSSTCAAARTGGDRLHAGDERVDVVARELLAGALVEAAGALLERVVLGEGARGSRAEQGVVRRRHEERGERA